MDQEESRYSHANKTPVTKSGRAEGEKDAQMKDCRCALRAGAAHTISSTVGPGQSSTVSVGLAVTKRKVKDGPKADGGQT